MNYRFFAALRVAETDLPLWKELWIYFLDTYFYSDTVYENLKIDGASYATLRTMLLGLLIGLCLASFAVVFNKRAWGDFVRLLLAEECLSPESAKTLPELNVAHKLWLRYGVRKSVNLRRVVLCREEEEAAHLAESEEADESARAEDMSAPKRRRQKAFRVDPDAHHFYIPEELKYTADVKFEKKGSGWWSAVLFCAVMLIVGFLALLFLPGLLSLLDQIVGAVNSVGSDQILT